MVFRQNDAPENFERVPLRKQEHNGRNHHTRVQAKPYNHGADVQRQCFYQLQKTTRLQYGTCQQWCHSNWSQSDHHINLQSENRGYFSTWKSLRVLSSPWSWHTNNNWTTLMFRIQSSKSIYVQIDGIWLLKWEIGLLKKLKGAHNFQENVVAKLKDPNEVLSSFTCQFQHQFAS